MGIGKAKFRILMLLILLSITTNAGLLLLTMHFNERQRAAQSEAIADVAEATARVLSLKLSSLAKEAKIIAAEVADSPDDLARVEARLHAAAAASGHHYILGDQKNHSISQHYCTARR